MDAILSLYWLQECSHSNKFGQGPGLHFLHHLGTMHLDGPGTDTEAFCQIFI